MPKTGITPTEAYHLFQQQAARLLPEAGYTHMVPEINQLEELELLKPTLRYDRFIFVLDLHNMRLKHVYGLEKLLGYRDKEFTLLKFLQIIHPAHFLTHNLSATAMIEGLMRGEWPVEFIKHRYITDICLVHANKTPYIFKRLGCPFQYDEKHRLLEYLNEFTLIDTYKEGTPYNIRALHQDGSKKWEDDVKARINKAFSNQHLFSYREIQVLRKFAYEGDASALSISNQLGIEKSTVEKFNKRCLQKASELFHVKFNTTKELAAFLRSQQLL